MRSFHRVRAGFRRVSWKPRTVKGRIITTFGIGFIVLAGVAIISAFQFQEHRDDLARAQEATTAANALEDARLQFVLSQQYLQDYARNGDDAAAALFSGAASTAQESIQLAREHAGPERGEYAASLDSLDLRLDGLVERGEELLVLVELGGLSDSEVSLTAFAAEASALQAEFGNAGQVQLVEVAQLQRHANTTAENALWFLVSASLGGAFLGIIVSSVVARSIIVPLGSLETTARAIASGDLKERAQVSQPVEFASLGDSLNRMTDSLLHLAYHDELTGLPNRMLFLDRLNVAIAQARRDGGAVGVMFVDLDQFKLVNDTAGHAEGNTLLRNVGRRLREVVRDADTVARLGGDEFALLTKLEREEDLAEAAKRVLQELRQRVVLKGHEFNVTASIGLAEYPAHGEDGEALLRNADIAMYRAKDDGRNRIKLYHKSMNAEIAERVAIEADLVHALEQDQLVVYYQPQFDIATGNVVGLEALVRWRHPERGLLLPDEFISVAEETGLIVPLGEWVLREACAQNVAWQEAGLAPLRMAVNVSALQFQERDLAAVVANVLRETRIKPGLLELEITESVAVQSVERTIATLNTMRQLGIQIAIDDFGTGQSSLAYLRQLPIDRLKIDRSFISDIKSDSDATITSSIIEMGRTLGLTVLAEGVETLEQLAYLKDQGCNEMQGFLWGKPMTADAVPSVLKQAVTARTQAA